MSRLEPESLDTLRKTHYTKHRRRTARTCSEGDVDSDDSDDDDVSFEEQLRHQRVMVTDLDQAAFDFAKQVRSASTADDARASSREVNRSPAKQRSARRHSDTKSALFTSPSSHDNKENTSTSGSDQRRRPYRLSAKAKTKNKKRARFTSENSIVSKLSPGCASPESPADGSKAFVRPPSRSVSLDLVVCKPEAVPEKLDFSQLEKFEGR